MKKIICFFILLTIIPISVYAKEYEYEDENAKLKYSINETIWTEKSLSTEREYIDKKWENSDCGVLMYGSSDLWGELSNEEKSGYSRAAFNSTILDNSFLETYKQVFTEMGYNITSSRLVDIGMQTMRYEGTATYNGMTFNYLGFLTLNNGYLTQWQYFGQTDTICTSRVYAAVNSVESTISNSGSSSSLNFGYGNIIFSLILTIFAYMIYPFIRTKIMNIEYNKNTCKKMALWNSIVVGGIFLILTTALQENATWSVGPAFIYYWINRTLWIKKDKSTNYTICENCGCKVLNKFKKCPKCGRVVK
ncbi:MAG: hypothetical protein PHU94_04925 [Bacilli bacterium]|nr:hypothetical protein [Bacilli bacterium]